MPSSIVYLLTVAVFSVFYSRRHNLATVSASNMWMIRVNIVKFTTVTHPLPAMTSIFSFSKLSVRLLYNYKLQDTH